VITMLKCSQITRALELMGQVLEDGRSAVRGMRLSKERMQNPDLAFSRSRKNSRFKRLLAFA